MGRVGQRLQSEGRGFVLKGLEGRRQAAQHRVASWRSQGASPGVLGRGRKAKPKKCEGKQRSSAIEDAVRAQELCYSLARHRRRWQMFRTLRACHDLKRPPFLDLLRAPCPWRGGDVHPYAERYRSSSAHGCMDPTLGYQRATLPRRTEISAAPPQQRHHCPNQSKAGKV